MNILIVDDMPDVVYGISHGIDWHALDFDRVLEATSVPEAREILRTCNVDILLSDVEMPGESGIDLLRWVRQEGLGCECIFLSAHPDYAYVRSAMNLDGYDYILQPARYSDIEAAVLQACEHLQARRKQEQLVTMALNWQEKQDSPSDVPHSAVEEKQYVEQIKQYVSKHLDDNITRVEVADNVYLSESYVSRLFRRETGVSLKNYIVTEKMKLARTLIQTTALPIGIVARRVGYSNLSHFSQTYKKEFGVSPTDERKGS